VSSVDSSEVTSSSTATSSSAVSVAHATATIESTSKETIAFLLNVFSFYIKADKNNK
jgi:hypothetical protein